MCFALSNLIIMEINSFGNFTVLRLSVDYSLTVAATVQYHHRDYCTLINRGRILVEKGREKDSFILFSLVSPLLRQLVCDCGRRVRGAYLILKKWPDRLSRHLTFPKSLEMYPAKIMKPLFHLFSFHFASSHRSVSFDLP